MKSNTIIKAAATAVTAGLLIFMGCKEDPASPPTGTFTLNATANPAAGGVVTKSPNRTNYAEDDVVIVTATPSEGYRFDGWSGAAEGTANPVNITMDGNKTLTANFSVDDGAQPGSPDTRWYTTNESAITYTITTADELAGLAELVNAGNMFAGKTVALGNDISLSSYGALNTAFNSGKGWIPIGANTKPFSGTFDGKRYEISGLYMNNTTQDNAGLFGYINGGDVTDLGVVGVDINSRQVAGAVVGLIDGGNIVNCYSGGTIRVANNTAGGLAGEIKGSGTVTTSFSTATVRGANWVGGLVGYFGGNSINNCYATGNVISTNAAGGLAGYANASITNCYATGAVSGSGDGSADGVSGLIGSPTASGSSLSILNCVALNSDIQAAGAFRVLGYNNHEPAAENNAGFVGITRNGNATTWPTGTAREKLRNGLDITAAEILNDPTIGNRFRQSNGWTIEPGKLPGLLGKAVDWPAHLVDADGGDGGDDGDGDEEEEEAEE